MFGISFSELLLVGLVALLVLGPERLPGAARTAGLWVGRLKRSFNAIKQEVEREIGADEIRRQLHNEHILSLEQEARKILAPTQQQPTPVEPIAEQTIHSPSSTPVAGTAPVTEAPLPTTPIAEPAAPVATPATTAPHDPTLPPRAP
ncbi:Sec-independent protein translocase protein TatB [Pseudomonas protegens]|uniref:Sec-independent protein translocase protein TatB n=1 Tax=Pseudomonas protegens TaxID=380021 RepID=UPI000F48DBF7|nr:Sec-independent protein translocase protein TatB [Pseudomonas protegens]ROL98752.1 Sec-independent protein translocase TatB [Pseudomonas protegens]ROL99297.1 Sec-independent protein translocase TatB [Pseudomonas protegens]ROM06874.1 Sec-independent protein translocase TatB [Pseudomonas protegens]ROM14318.1 Sec-independent protein translocase TatB [Pseudomonas protegens]